MAKDGEIIQELYDVIMDRRNGDPQESYVAKLYQKGRGKIAQKFGEEAVETIVAALHEEKKDIINESTDALFHLLILWAETGVTPEEIYKEIDSRMGKTGLRD